MAPHVNGFDSDYTTPNASKDKLYEEDLYNDKQLNYKDGWKLYLPGDMVNSLSIYTFGDASSCTTINAYHTLQKPLISKCKTTGFDKCCPLYCRTRKDTVSPGYDYIIIKIKINCKSKFVILII